jgi:hypothetical protein
VVVRPFDFAQGDANDIYKKAEKSEKSGAEKKPSTEGKEAKAAPTVKDKKKTP